MWSIEHGMYGYSKFDNTERGSEVSASLGHRRNHLGPDFISERLQFGIGQHLEVCRSCYAIEKRCIRAAHGVTSQFML
jgi:hypothetical protein